MAELIADTTTGSLADKFEEVARLAVRLALQSALEAEVTEFLGRDRYARGERERNGSRNGYSPVSIKSTAGEVTLQRPKVRGAAEGFASRLLGIGVTRTNALESLVIAGFVRGLSVRDVEASLADALGPDSTVSKSTVSRICEAIKTEFDAWKTRDLSEVELDYLFADGSFFRMHPGAPAEPVLVAWGITTAGKPVFLGLEPGSAESHDAWAGFFRGLTARGLGDPLLVISDGGAGLIGAAELCFEHSLRQRCLIHRSWQGIRCRFRSWGLAGVVCAHAHTDGGPWSTRREVRGLVAASQRAPAALGVGGRGAAAGARWRARGRAGGWRERDDRP
jgi:transposase-like protein